MELVYLWVEDYKNIQKQGFNFSPRFSCHYDEEKNELTIDENDDYIPDFFGENINVTAIVGKNGSGKSSILELFINLNQNILLVYKINGVLYYHFNTILNFIDIEKKNISSSELEYYIYFSDKQILEKSEDFETESKNRILLNDYIIGDMICNKYITQVEFILTTFMYIPKIINIQVNLDDMIHKLVSDNTNNIPDFSAIDIDLDDKAWDNERKNMRNQQFAEEDGLNDIFYPDEDITKFSTSSLSEEYRKFIIYWYIVNYGYDDISQLEDIEFVLSEYNEHEEALTEEEFKRHFQNRNLETNTLTIEDKKIYFKYYKEYFSFDFIDSKNRRYKELSHGERTIFGELLNIYFYSMNNEKSNLLLLFDEPDISLHPNWQKKYLSELIVLLNKIDKKYHFIFTTHSPFLLSDLPKENIIFLDKDENGKCKVVDGLKEKKQTFGANIHTLLSDSFFMEDGLMGDFAKGKINDVYNFIVNHKTDKIKTKKDTQDIINIIGEPLIQRELQQLFDKKFELSDMSIDDEITVLERKLNALKKIKNDTD